MESIRCCSRNRRKFAILYEREVPSYTKALEIWKVRKMAAQGFFANFEEVALELATEEIERTKLVKL